ncbi:MAG TPA: AI-2E family transporter [Terriglobales bacterium]|nr:AI-2E family transporter [Terriglobales bacterium]
MATERAELKPPDAPAIPRPPQTMSRANWAQNLIGVGAVLALCYYGEIVLAVLMISVLLAFILAPVVDILGRLRLPRALSSGIAMMLLLAAIAGIIYFSYNQATSLVEDLPKYTTKIRQETLRFRQKAESFEVLNPQHEKGVLNVRPATDWTEVLTRGFGSVSQSVFAASFIPFLAYFMLTWQEHVRSATVMLFPMENRHTAYTTLGLISAMIRSFMVGNLLIGVFMGIISTAAFGALHIPFFYFAGFLSGFLSLIPYLGVVLAIAPPIFLGLGHIGSQDLLWIVITVLGLHLLTLNVLYPKFLGNRLQLNPLAVTISLLVWAWLWGGIGLVLAIPMTAAMKIIFDHIESLKPFGNWLGE